MAEQLTRQQIEAQAEIRAEAPRAATSTDRTFELPNGLYAATVVLYLGFIGTLALGLSHPEMIIPYVMFAFIIVVGFGIPTVWTRLAPATKSKAKGWGRFRLEGIMTAYGRTSSRDAAVQVLILPVLIFVWGLIAVTIAALV